MMLLLLFCDKVNNSFKALALPSSLSLQGEAKTTPPRKKEKDGKGKDKKGGKEMAWATVGVEEGGSRGKDGNREVNMGRQVKEEK